MKIQYIIFFILFILACDNDKISINPTTEYQYDIPVQINDGWETAALSSVDINEQPIVEMLNSIYNGNYQNIHSILIVRNDKLVFEEYFTGEKFELAQYTGEYGFDIVDTHNLCSATKSFTSACLGIAIDKGFITDVNQKVFDFFPEYSYILNNHPDKQILTIEHLLTMTSGLAWNDAESSYYEPDNDMNRMFSTGDPIRYILSKPLINAPGSVYDYQNCNTNVIAGIIHKTTGKRLDDFSREYLFDKLGIYEQEWQIMPNEAVLASGELKLKPRDMAKFGLLFLNYGYWNSEQIISQDWVETSTFKHIPLTNAGRIWEDGYGYQWWHKTFNANTNTYHSYFADGWGGQTIYVFPDINTVIVFTGGNYYESIPNGEILVQHILPAINIEF